MNKRSTLLLLPLIAVPLLVNYQTEQVNADINIRNNESLDYSKQIVDDFDNGFNNDNWYISHRVWGENFSYNRFNGGVIPDNVYYDNNEGAIKIIARGNEYAKNEVSGVGTIKDGSLTGGALISKFTVTPGRYEVRMKVAPNIGVCNAFWLYTEDDSARNHELDFELPGWNTYNKLSYNQVLCSSWLGERNHTSTDASVSVSAADGEYHTFTFDWYYSNNNKCVDYFYDGAKIASHNTNIPFYENRIWLGAWIPNNDGFVGIPDFDMSMMSIDYVSYIPFKNQTYTPNTPYVSSSQIGNESKYPIKESIDIRNKFPNGDFEYLSVREENYSKTGLNFSGNYDFTHSLSNGHYVHLKGGSISSSLDTINGNNDYSFSAVYKGEGNLSINFYNMDDTLIETKNIDLENKISMSFSGDKVVKAPKGTYYANVIIEGDDLSIDDIVFEDYESEVVEETDNDSYATNLLNNDNISHVNEGFQFNDTLYFDGDDTHPWIVSSYEKLSRDNKFRFGYYNETSGANTFKEASISNYTGNDKLSLTYKQLYNNSIQFNDPATFYAQAMFMDYDITHFENISIHLNNILDCNAWQPYMIHYSIDSGNTWKYLTHTFGRNLTTKGDSALLNNYTISANRAMIDEEFEHIRFAFTLTSYGSHNNQLIYMGGIVINNYNSFKNFIDGKTCSLKQEQIDLLNVLYQSLTTNEVANCKRTYLSNYPSKTYFDGYNEIISRFYSLNSKNDLLINEIGLEALIIVSSLSALLILFIFIRRKGRRI